MLRVELSTQLLRIRTLMALACLAAVPALAALATASHAGHRNGDQGGLFGASTYSALNHTMASLQFIAPLLLPIVVALLACAIASADRDWGTLRYLYVAPVTRSRLLAGELGAVAVSTLTATGCVLGGRAPQRSRAVRMAPLPHHRRGRPDRRCRGRPRPDRRRLHAAVHAQHRRDLLRPRGCCCPGAPKRSAPPSPSWSRPASSTASPACTLSR
ncbi:ABC transporter permease [Spirillospora sp. CA-108201]